MELPRGAERKMLERTGALVASVLLPAPPSTNNLFRSVVIRNMPRRVQTSEYKDWQRDAGPIAARLRSPAAYPATVWLMLRGKWYKQRDIDNIAKPILDLLVSVGVLADDNLSCVGSLHIVHVRDGRNDPMVSVEIAENEPNLFGD